MVSADFADATVCEQFSVKPIRSLFLEDDEALSSMEVKESNQQYVQTEFLGLVFGTWLRYKTHKVAHGTLQKHIIADDSRGF